MFYKILVNKTDPHQGINTSGAVTLKFCVVPPNIGGSSGRKLLYVTRLARIVLKWFPDFWKICTPLL